MTRTQQYLEQKGWLLSKIDVSNDLGERPQRIDRSDPI